MTKTFWGWAGDWGRIGIIAGRRPRFFDQGELRIAILSLLSDGPKHGYQLMKEMKERSGGTYEASAGSIYPNLQQLEDEGLIVSERENGRRVYRLTEAGRKELDDHPDSAERIWERAESWEQWGRNFGPFFGGDVGPLGELIRSAVRSARWAAEHPESQDKLRALWARARREMDELRREKE